MNESHTESVQFDVNLPKPSPRSAILKIIAGVAILGVIGVVAAVIINRTASPTADATAQVMPANTQLFFSMATHPDKQPNFDIVANAWKNSKEARQIEAALSLALTSAGYSWDNDIAPWLGDRAAFGLIDLGGYDKPAEPATSDKPQIPKYRAPFFLAAVQTKDKGKSDAFLANVRKQIEVSAKSSSSTAPTFADDNYRGIPIMYMAMETGDSATKSDLLTLATVNDVIVLTINRDQLKQAIDAALNGTHLAASEAFKTTMAALPSQNVAALYMDVNRFMTSYFEMLSAVTASTADIYDNIYAGVSTPPGATPDPNMIKQREERKRQREEAQRQQQAQLQQMSELMQAYGGTGMAMTYEPGGIRFDVVEQFDVGRLPEKWRTLFGASMTTPTTNKMFDALPASTQMVMNGAAALIKGVLDPDYLGTALSSNPALGGVDFAKQLKDFQQLTGVNLKTDLLDLINGEYAVTLSIKDPSKSGYAMPLDAALLLDSSDAARLTANVDKVMQAVAALSNNSVKWQNLSGLPYSVLLDRNGSAMFTYGVVDGRFVLGTNSETLLAIDNADKAPLSADATFKDALTGLPANRLQTFYFNFKPLWDMLQPTSSMSEISGVLNYLRPFKYVSIGSEAPSGNLTRGVMRLALEAK